MKNRNVICHGSIAFDGILIQNLRICFRDEVFNVFFETTIMCAPISSLCLFVLKYIVGLYGFKPNLL